MMQLESLDKVMEYIYQKHKAILDKHKGIFGYLMLRHEDGRRSPFEKIEGFRILKHSILNENTLMFQTFASGIATDPVKKIVPQNIKSHLMLHNLSLIHIYDHSAEFYSSNRIDFIYVQKDILSTDSIIDEWIRGDSGVLKAKWYYGNKKDIQKLEDEVEEFHFGRLKLSTNKTRYLDMDIDF